MLKDSDKLIIFVFFKLKVFFYETTSEAVEDM